ncbi:MAG TPA: iron-containing redox enzyme family protein [Stellaceae bacterium]|nr:iron-containing redox enzyme family protein [Stellaceae bacterium]
MNSDVILKKMDEVVDGFCRRTRMVTEPTTKGRARMFVKQHRLNTRQRNSVLKLRVATNCPHWDTKLDIIKACAQEIVADDEFGDGRPHWKVMEDLGVSIGVPIEEILATKPIATTEIAWAAWEGLMSNRHWLEGIVANTCAERINVPGYGTGDQREHGWSWVQGHQWAKLFGLKGDELAFFKMHEQADLEHSNMGWKAVAQFAEEYRMEEAVVHACDINLQVWTLYFDGIVEAGERQGA